MFLFVTTLIFMFIRNACITKDSEGEEFAWVVLIAKSKACKKRGNNQSIFHANSFDIQTFDVCLNTNIR